MVGCIGLYIHRIGVCCCIHRMTVSHAAIDMHTVAVKQGTLQLESDSFTFAFPNLLCFLKWALFLEYCLHMYISSCGSLNATAHASLSIVLPYSSVEGQHSSLVGCTEWPSRCGPISADEWKQCEGTEQCKYASAKYPRAIGFLHCCTFAHCTQQWYCPLYSSAFGQFRTSPNVLAIERFAYFSM